MKQVILKVVHLTDCVVEEVQALALGRALIEEWNAIARLLTDPGQ